MASISLSAAAQRGAPSANDVATARRLFAEGQAAAVAGRSAEAARAFRRSLELVPRPSTAYNLAYTYRGEGNLLESRGILTAALNGDYGELEEYSALFSQLLNDVERALARVEFTLQREDARPGEQAWLEISGLRTLMVAPTKTLELNPGTVVLRGGAPRHISRSLRIDLEPGATRELTLQLRVAREPGTLVVRTEDPAAHISVAGVGSADGLFRQTLQPGFYNIEVLAEGERTRRRVELLSGRLLEVVIERAGGVNGWLVAGIVLGAVVLGSGLAFGIVTVSQEPEPVRDPFWGVTEALSAPPR